MSSNLFQVLNAHALAASLPEGSLLFRLGDPATSVYVVRKGKIALVWSASNGVHPMDSLGPGNIIGLPGVFNKEYSMAARAVEDSELGVVHVDTLMSLLETNRDLMRGVLELLAKDVAKMRGMLGKSISRKPQVIEKLKQSNTAERGAAPSGHKPKPA